MVLNMETFFFPGQIAQKFVEQCAKGLGELVGQRGLCWQVTSCGWSEEEQADRVTRCGCVCVCVCVSVCVCVCV